MRTTPAFLVFLASLFFTQSGQKELSKEYILYFTADWCAPCQKVKSEINELKKYGWIVVEIEGAMKTTTVPIYIVNVDKNLNLSAKYNVDLLPTLIKIVNDKEVDRIVGVTDKFKIAKLANKRIKI